MKTRGVALPLVLAVLVCLVAVAIPFALSMQHEQGGVAYRTHEDEARRAAMAVRDMALAHLGATAPDRDDTPWVDSLAELDVDVAARADDLAILNLGPRGRLLSASVEDQSGRVDINCSNLFLTARLLGMATTLSSKLTPDDKQFRLSDGDFLADSGFLWIDGEVTYYQRREGSTIHDFQRPAIVPGVWEPPLLPTEPREFAAGTQVIDFRAWMVAAWPWKAQAGIESRFESITHPLAIANFGRGALGPAERARLEQFATIWSADGGRDRFGNAQRILTSIIAGETQQIRIEQGQFVGAGMLARITTFGGREVEYGFVLRSQERGEFAELTFEMAPRISVDAGQAKVEFLLPRPVNVNSCTRETLALLLEGLQMRGGGKSVNRDTAELVAARIVQARPLDGMRSLIVLLDEMVEREKVLDGAHRVAILRNAEHSGCYDLEFGTAPFCYATDGVVDVRAAASLNWENGREQARALVREVVATAAAGVGARIAKTQRDFDEPWRISRLARGWTTFPENLNFWSGGIGSADPPSRLIAMASPRLRFPIEEMRDSAVRLAPAWYDLEAMPADRTWHFDGRRDDFESDDPDGWRLSDGPIALNTNGNSPGVAMTQNLSGIERPKPFGISMWWNPGTNLTIEQTLFDWQCNSAVAVSGLSDRVRLRMVAAKLELEVDDAFLRASEDDLYTAKIVYDFTDGLPLEGDTWYHVTAFCRGNRAGQMSLWVDGKPRGKYSHYARTTGAFTASAQGANRIAIDPKRLANGTAKFPPRGAVRINNDVFEYSSVNASNFTVQYDQDNRFGGIRPAPPLQLQSAATSAGTQATSSTNHPATSGVELYGYAARLDSDLPAGEVTLDSNGLGEFGVAMVSPAMGQANIEVAVTNPGPPPLGGNNPSITLGRGFDSDATTILVSALDGGKLPSSKPPLSRNGGYAALVGYYFGTLTPNDPTSRDEGGTLESTQSTTGSWIQGVEIIHYGAFDGAQLTKVVRGQSLKSAEIKSTDLAEYDDQAVPSGGGINTIYHFTDKHAWVVVPDKQTFAAYTAPFFTILVVPLSVIVSGSPKLALLVPEQQNPGFDRCEMAQIGSPTSHGVFDPTEWIRYDAIVQDQNGRWNLLRADPKRLGAAESFASSTRRPSGQSNAFDGNGAADYLLAIASNPLSYAMSSAAYEDFVEALNQESLYGGDPDNNSGGHRLAFRGVLDTGYKDKEHEGGESIYPVWRTSRTGPKPGRYDEITIVGSNREPPERHFLNYAWCNDSAEDWSGSCHCALLAEGAGTKFVRTQNLGVQATSATNVAANIAWYGDSRNFARILKFPSGELPSLADPGSQITIGGSLGGTGGAGAAGGAGEGAKIDEVRVFATDDPQPIMSHGLHVLNRELTATEQDRFEIGDDLLRFPHQTSGSIGATPNLHGDASVWQIGDEFIVCGERQMGQPVVQEIAPDGRIKFSGTDDFYVAGYHAQGEMLQVLPWLVMTRLAAGMSSGDSEIALNDPAGFPPKGCVMIDQEVLAYTSRQFGGGGGSGQALYVPTFLADPDGRSSQSRGEAAFRGRFGTPVMTHSADAVVFFWNYRYADGYHERCDIPEMATLEMPFAARRGLFHALSWIEQKSDPLVKLIATVRVQGQGGFTGDPEDDPDLFVFDQPGTRERPNRIDRQGDLLRVRFNVDYLDGALDSVDFTKNSWKRAPLIEIVSVEQLAGRVVELHEESR
ncbi:MAG: hypothetical protein EXS13_10545 [Planctomycetes bacterium]|nr:hypothetical protein [Planctomycetota bacterium]